jgi:hypothetical protein
LKDFPVLPIVNVRAIANVEALDALPINEPPLAVKLP